MCSGNSYKDLCNPGDSSLSALGISFPYDCHHITKWFVCSEAIIIKNTIYYFPSSVVFSVSRQITGVEKQIKYRKTLNM